jgi:hypothetical protein
MGQREEQIPRLSICGQWNRGGLKFDTAQKYENAIKNDTGKKEPDSVLKTLSLEKNLVGLFN